MDCAVTSITASPISSASSCSSVPSSASSDFTSRKYRPETPHSGNSTLIADDGRRTIDSSLAAMNGKGKGLATQDDVAEASEKSSRGPSGELPLNGETDNGSPEADETYPEGGLQAWLVVLGSWMALLSALGLMNTMATFQTYIATNQLANYPEGTIGWIFSLYAFLVFFCGIYIGPIFDKYGPKWLVLTGTVCLVASLMLLSICTEYWHFLLAFGLLQGVGASLLFTPSIAAVGHFFKARRGLATGMASTGGSIGGIIFPLMLQALFERVGWNWAIRTLGLVCLLLCLVANLLIRSRLPPAHNASAHPDFRILGDPAFLLTTIGIFMVEFALFIPLTYISSYMLAEGFSRTFAFQILPVLNAGSVLGRALPGYWGDRFGPFNSNLTATLLAAVSCLAIWLPGGHTTGGIVTFALLFGFASGNNISISPVCIGRLCRTQSYGRYYATTYTVSSVACLIGVPIAGQIITACGGEYWGLIVFTGLIYFGGFMALLAAKGASVGKTNLLANF